MNPHNGVELAKAVGEVIKQTKAEAYQAGVQAERQRVLGLVVDEPVKPGDQIADKVDYQENNLLPNVRNALRQQLRKAIGGGE